MIIVIIILRDSKDMPEKREELQAEKKEMKQEILRQVIQLKIMDIKHRQKLWKIRSDRK